MGRGRRRRSEIVGIDGIDGVGGGRITVIVIVVVVVHEKMGGRARILEREMASLGRDGMR